MSQLIRTRTPVLVFTLLLGLAAAWRASTATAQQADSVELTTQEKRDQAIMERFQQLLEQNPRYGTALDRLYGYHVERGTLDQIIQHYRDEAAGQKDGSLWMIAGMMESLRGNDGEAVKAFRQAETLLPDNALPAYYLGQSLILVGQPDKAAQAFERAIARNPDRNDVLEIFKALGRVHQRAQRHQKALEVWNRLQELFPGDLRVQEQVATILSQEGRNEEALKRFDALASKADDPYRQITFAMKSAELLVRMGKKDDALTRFEKLLRNLKPQSWLFRDVRRQIEEVYLRQDDLAGLTRYYEQWIEKHPEDVGAMTRIGRTLAYQGRTPEAREWFKKALNVAPSDKDLHRALIEQLVSQNKWKEAIAQYEKLNEADPNNPDHIREWGLLHLKDKEIPLSERQRKARQVWDLIIKARPNDAVTVSLVADLCRQAKIEDRAIELYKKAIELAPGSPQYREYLGEYYHSLDRRDEAVTAWKEMASAENRTVENLVRLAEVLASFGYAKQAVEPMAEACTMDPNGFLNAVKYSQLLFDVGKHSEALAELNRAESLAESDDERQEVLAEQIKNLQASEKMAAAIQELKARLGTPSDSVDDWLRLAAYLHAENRRDESSAAIRTALKINDESIIAWTMAAQIFEGAGDLQSAIDAYRKLALLDRRFKTDHLTSLAGLELRLGRSDQALQAGRDLIAAAPGNPEHYQTFAALCFQLGRTEEGLDALRRSVRVNPANVEALLALANSLADHFRTAEAIELYWRAFEKSDDVEEKLAIVAKLAQMYLRTNTQDRLLDRLTRFGKENKQERSTALCIAQAHQESGDFGSARDVLEQLLNENPRDTQLLSQLSTFAETQGDLEGAVAYQSRLNEIAPSREVAGRLARIYLKLGDVESAQQIWTSFQFGRDESYRVLRAIDDLLAKDRNDAVLGMTQRLLRDNPNDWEALYREGVALTGLDRKREAAKKFQAILALDVDPDKKGEITKSFFGRKSRPGATPTNPFAPKPFPLQTRMSTAWELQYQLGLGQNYYSSTTRVWSPQDFGQCRKGAIGWLYSLAPTEEAKENLVASLQQRLDEKDYTAGWDLLFLHQLRQKNVDVHKVASKLLQSGTSEAAWAYLSTMGSRHIVAQAYSSRSRGAKDSVPPLSPEELDKAVRLYEELKTSQPSWVNSSLTSAILTELLRAKRQDQEKELYRQTVAQAKNPDEIRSLFQVASQRGDVEAILDLFDRFEASLASQGGRPNTALPSSHYLITTMSKLEGDDKPAQSLRLFDRYVVSLRKLKSQTPSYVWKRRNVSRGSSTLSFSVMPAPNVNRYVRLDYPSANVYYDAGSIMILRNVYEIYKHADVSSDLHARFADKAENLEGEDQLYATLALTYLHWWDEESAEALEQLSRAAELARGESFLKFDLARLREQQGEVEEALEILDSMELLDQRSISQREQAAIRLAVLAGDVDRARKAAERLFGLRLDSSTQIALAQQMHQLGMHKMAQGVLNRARRRAGSQTSTLLSLMSQYQSQGDIEKALQIAHQVLRNSRPIMNSQGRDQNESARRQALGVLAASGKLNALIERARQQYENSPDNVQNAVLLASYYKAMGDNKKVVALYQEMVKRNPKDAKLRYRVAEQLRAANEVDAALEHYLAALSQEPSLISNNYWRIINVFQQAKKLDQLAEVFEEVDLRKMGRYYVASQIIEQLIRNPETQQLALRLLKKAFEAFPRERFYIISSIYDQKAWELSEMYHYALEATIPTADQVAANPWWGADRIYSYSGDGTVTGMVTRLFQAATKQNKLRELRTKVQEHLTKHPKWLGGQAILAILDSQQGNPDAAKKQIEQFLADEDLYFPSNARWILGQEIEKFDSLRPLAMKLYEGADYRENNMEFSYSPQRRLVKLYGQQGEKSKARQILMDAVNSKSNEYSYDPGYQAYRRIQEVSSIGQELTNLGYAADAVRLLNDLVGDKALMSTGATWYGGSSYLEDQARRTLNSALEKLDKESLVRTLRERVDSEEAHTASNEDEKHEDDKPKSDAPDEPSDLLLVVMPKELRTATVTSLFHASVKSAANQKQLLEKLAVKLGAVRETDPDNIEALVAQVLVAMELGDRQKLTELVDELNQTLDEHPLEVLSEGRRANSRQRAAAFDYMGLWLLARELADDKELSANADAYAAVALEAARRQRDPYWALAMLRERAQDAIEHNDSQAARQYFEQMIRIVLPPKSTSAKKAEGREQAESAPPKNATSFRSNAAPVVGALVRSALGSAWSKAAPLMLSVQAVPVPALSLVGPRKSMVRAAPGVVTLDRFQQAVELAQFAAEKKMPDVSLDVVARALHSGPPVVPMQSSGRSGIVRSSSSTSTNRYDDVVATELEKLNNKWRTSNVDPGLVYQTLAAAVFPERRSLEMFIYSHGGRGTTHQSVGSMLVDWAVRADALEDLKNRLNERRKNQSCRFDVAVVETLLAQRTKDDKLAQASLAQMNELLSTNAVTRNANLASKVVLPMLRRPESAEGALPVLQQAATILGGDSNSNFVEDAGNVHLQCARAVYQDDLEHGRKLLEEYLTTMSRMNVRYSGDYMHYRRRQQLSKAADVASRFGDWENAWKLMGDFVDAPKYRSAVSVTGPVNRLARRLADLDAGERYQNLAEWMFPSDKRKTVRILGSFVFAESLPEGFSSDAGHQEWTDDMKVFSTAEELVDAARETNKLQSLADQAKQWADQGVPNADFLWLHAELALGRATAVKDKIAEKAESFRKRTSDSNNRQMSWEDYSLARAAANALTIAAPANTYLTRIRTYAQNVRNYQLQVSVKRDMARLAARRAKINDADLAEPPSLALWQPVSHYDATRVASGLARPCWKVVGDHVLHAYGWDAVDRLMFACPLLGDFQIEADVFDGGWAEGQIAYSGFDFSAYGHNNRGTIQSIGRDSKTKVFPFTKRNDFNHWKIQVNSDAVRFWVNGYPIGEVDDPSATSPWFSLLTARERQTYFRNIKITGNPTVPKQLELVGPGLDGWIGTFLRKSLPNRFKPAKPKESVLLPLAVKPEGRKDWSFVKGELRGGRRASSNDPIPNLVQYLRPLQDGDVVDYEFRYIPNETQVFPCVGRLAFVFDDQAVGLHWIPPQLNVAQSDLAEISIDNLVGVNAEPPKLSTERWNKARVSLDDGVVTLAINGTELLSRRLRSANNRVFGFFHYADRSSARVRNVVLKGNWPNGLSPEDLANLLRPADPNVAVRQAQLGEAVMGPHVFALSAFAVYQHAMTLSPAERYDYLLSWVCPSDSHRSFRFFGDFAPRVVPGGAENQPAIAPGTFTCPAILLVETAQELNKLADLRKAVAKMPKRTGDDKRCANALRGIVHHAMGDHDAALAVLEMMYPYLKKVNLYRPSRQLWPHFALAWQTMQTPKLYSASLAFVEELFKKRHQDADWGLYVRHLRSRCEFVGMRQGSPDVYGSKPTSKEWSAASMVAAKWSGNGVPLVHWQIEPGQARHHCGSNHDLLFFNAPLRGDFEVSAKLSMFDWRECQILYAGEAPTLIYTRDKMVVKTHAGDLSTKQLDPPVSDLGREYDFRLVVQGGKATSFVNGRKVLERNLPSKPDPWLALRSPGMYAGTFHDVRILGTPSVAEQIDLTAPGNLQAWFPYYSEPLTGNAPIWFVDGPEIKGRLMQNQEDLWNQHLLRYHRPLLEDAQIDYEFYYVPEKTICHPALGRLVMMLEPDGVKIHWATDAQYDATGLPPNNRFEPSPKVGPEKLPLKPRAWNKVRLRLTGDVLKLALNGVDVFEQTIKPRNARLFGLFRYADKTDSRVRKLIYRGDWSKTVPSIEEQELAGRIDEILLASERLKETFGVDFRKQAVDPKVFAPRGDLTGLASSDENGLRIDIPEDGKERGWNGYATRFGVRGDFVATLSFELLDVPTPKKGYGVGPELVIASYQNDFRAYHTRCFKVTNNTQRWGSTLSRRYPDDAIGYPQSMRPCDVDGGRLRLVRRGATMYSMYAEPGEDFKVIEQRYYGDHDLDYAGFTLTTGNAAVPADVRFFDFEVRAEQFVHPKEHKAAANSNAKKNNLVEAKK